MKRKNDRRYNNSWVSRREFLKYTGGATGLFLTGRWISNPKSAIAHQPPRVVSVHDSNATNWDYATGYHWEYIDQEIVNNMVARGVKALTGRINTIDAWNDIIPYSLGENVAIKVNLNNSRMCEEGDDHGLDALSETVNALIDGLISINVPPSNIWVTDPSKVISDRFRNRITNADVQYFGYEPTCNDPNVHEADFVAADSPHASVAQCPEGEKIRPAQVFVDANHLINVPILKSHGTYVTLALKNHYGSVKYENYNWRGMHPFFNQGENTEGCDLERKNIIADINNNPHIRDKTRLVIGDGLYGNPHTHKESVERWQIFNNNDPNILFFSLDPVAISSVMTDYIIAERSLEGESQDHEQLHAGHYIGLGVHDHWDSFENKQYSLIDYINMDLNNCPGDFNCDKDVDGSDLAGYIFDSSGLGLEEFAPDFGKANCP